MEKNKIVDYHDGKVIATVSTIDDGLEIHLHDLGGWFMTTENVLVGLYISRDMKNIVEILDSELEYDSKYITNSLGEDGDLNWIYWLSGGNAFWSEYDTEYMYSYLLEDYSNNEDDNENEEFDKLWDDILTKYDKDKIQEELKGRYEDEVMALAQNSSSWTEFLNDLKDLSDTIQETTREYLIDFVVENAQ